MLNSELENSDKQVVLNHAIDTVQDHALVEEQLATIDSRPASRPKSHNPIGYRNGRKIEQLMFSYETYFKHQEKMPKHYYPLVQYLENVEVKYHNDNLFEDTPLGFPTRAQLLRERSFRLPIIKDTSIQKARYQRKLEETQSNIVSARKKYDFKTYDNFSSHYFLTGARFNRTDTIDSKILNKYGIFVHRKNPELVYIKSSKKALESLSKDREEMKKFEQREPLYRSKSIQCDASELKKLLNPSE